MAGVTLPGRPAARHGRWLPVVIVPMLLFASIYMGARLPGGASGGAGLGPLDLSRGPTGSFATLREGYLAGLLGSPAREPVAAAPHTRPRVAPALVGPRRPVEHPPTNDDFDKAYPVPGVPFTAKTSSERTSREAGEPGGCAPIGNTVWYRFRPASDIGLIANTFGTGRPATLGVFTGSDLTRLEEAGCSRHPRGNAHVPIAAKAGVTYHFQVASVSDGDLVFDVRPQGITELFHPPGALLFTYGPLVSPSGRFITYSSSRAGGLMDAYVYDRVTRRSTPMNVSDDGTPGNNKALNGTVSQDGRYVALNSFASNLVPGDTNTCRQYVVPGMCPDIFVHDRDADEDGILDETHPGARKVVRVSVSSEGREADAGSAHALMSADGRYVTFMSWATNLVDDDTNGVGDVFVHDRDADEDGTFDETHPGGRRTWRISVSSSGAQAEDPLVPLDERRRNERVGTALDRSDYFPAEAGNDLLGVSSNGRFATFRSRASNLVPGDTNGLYDVFLHEIRAGKTTRINVSTGGRQADRGTRLANSIPGKISDDGRYALFNSDATNLVPGDANGAEDLFIRDLARGTTERITLRADGGEASGEAPANGQDLAAGGIVTGGSLAAWGFFTLSELNYTMSADGRFILFSSGGVLVDEDENGQRDVYVRDRLRGTLSLISISTGGVQGNQSSNGVSISPDGRVVAFASQSTNLTDDAPETMPVTPLYQIYIRSLPTVP